MLQKGDLELAVLSAFQVEPEWVISKLDPSTKVVWILQAKTEWERKNFESEAPSNYKFCFPSVSVSLLAYRYSMDLNFYLC